MKKQKQTKPTAKRVRKHTIGTGRKKAKHPKLREEALERGRQYKAIIEITDETQRLIALRAFERTYVAKDLLEREPRLQHRAWVGYRYMGSVERTALFGQEYIAAYRRAYVHIDPSTAGSKRPTEAVLFENSRYAITCLYKARQEADRRGMPYDVFLDVILQGRVQSDKWANVPLPNQILKGDHGLVRLRGHPTRDEVGARLFSRDWDRRYFIPRTADDPVQAAALLALHADVLQADRPASRLARYLSIAGVLSEAQARTLFDVTLVDEALKTAVLPRVPAEDGPAKAYVPACQGHRKVAKNSPCGGCPITRECKAVTARITGALIAASGSGDPRMARKREQGKIRQRNKRARDRAKRRGVGDNG